jgi:hypothetical protein
MLACFFENFSNKTYGLAMLVGRTVREIDAKDVRASRYKLGQNGLRRRSGA